MFTERFIDSLPEDPIQAAYDICSEFIRKVAEDERRNSSGISGVDNRLLTYDEYLEAFGAFQAFCEAYNLQYDFPLLGKDISENISTIDSFFERTHGELQEATTDINVVRYKNKYLIRFGNVFAYEFSEGDINRIQELVNELREITTDSKLFDVRYKERLLKKIEALQSEINKKMLSLDRFYGFMGEAGVALGRFGNDVKPLVDRISELLRIVWRTQARAEELESGHPHPLLGTGEKDTEE